MTLKISTFEHDNIIDLYNIGRKIKDIANIYHVFGTTISNILNKHHVNMRGNRKYKFNEDYFEKIDTEEKAYILGFLYADGCNFMKRGAVSLALNNKDVKILERINSCLNNERPIRFEISNNSASINFSSRKFSNTLNNLGCVPRKSLILKFPTENQVPKYLLNHFIRGYFDGDGCIGIYKNKLYKNISYVYKFNIISTHDFCKSLSDIFNKEININSCICHNKLHNILTKSLWVSGNQQILKVLDYLYKDATIYLDRKYEKFCLAKNYNTEKYKIKVCRINSCENTNIVKGYCRPHYYQIKVNNKTYLAKYMGDIDNVEKELENEINERTRDGRIN